MPEAVASLVSAASSGAAATGCGIAAATMATGDARNAAATEELSAMRTPDASLAERPRLFADVVDHGCS